MRYRDAETLSARGQIQFKYAKRAAKLVNVFQCLIVSSDQRRREMFERAAAEGGWQTYLCADATAALACLNRSVVQLAVVDLESRGAETLRPVIEGLTALGGPLLIVCGNEGNIEEEVWVRRLGAWLYLPGVIDGSNFTLLCGEARQIAQRLWKAARPEIGSDSPAAQRGSFS
jgi:ActR/RegA family two-component response regulator